MQITSLMSRLINCSLIISIIFLFASCGASHKAMGWYLVDENYTRPVGEAIFKADDFQSVFIDTLINPGITTIQMELKPNKIQQLRDISTRNIGHGIGFFYNDSVITAPRINAPIESGNLQIISPDSILMHKILESLHIQSHK